jgi:GTP-binding protein EngB required for normal cell division
METAASPVGTADATLAGALATLARAARVLGVAGAAEQATQVAERLAGLELEVAVVGEFKRGKSSLINALLDTEVLPVGALPLTAVPTVLERGDPACLVEFADGHGERHPLDAVGRFVTEEANPGNRLGVDRVVARLHTPLLDEGVRLVDTPGVGSVHEHNTAATDAYLPSLDAAVLVTAADPPISKAERAFLERVATHAVRLFVVLNKADYLTPAEVERIVAFTERVVREVAPDWPGPVYALSARADVGDPAALRRFRHDLERFLRGDRAATVSDSARRSGQRLLGSLRLTLDLERHAAALPADQLQQRRRRLEQTIDRLADDAAADAALLQAAVRRAVEALDQTVRAGAVALERQAVRATVQAAGAHADLGPGKLLEVLQAERPGLLERLCRPTVEGAGAAAVAAYRRAAVPVTDRAISRIERLQAEAASAFGVPIPAFIAPELDLEVPRVRFTHPRVTLLAEDIAPAAWRLLGARAARARATARARAQAIDETRMVFGRLRGETSQQLGEAARQLGARLRRHQAELGASLVTAVERGQCLVAQANQDRTRRTRELDRAAALLARAEGALVAG